MLPRHHRYDYSPLIECKDYSWPGGKRLAFSLTTNISVRAFGTGRGHDNARHGEPQTRRNYFWRIYGNRWCATSRSIRTRSAIPSACGPCAQHFSTASRTGS